MSGEYAADVVADLKRMVQRALPRWELSPNTSITLLNLSENATFLLNDGFSGRNLVLRVHRLGYSSAQEIGSELSWIRALRESQTVATAAPIPGADGETVQTLSSPSGRASRYAVAFERLPGVEPDASSGTAAWFERLGELTARMHQHARTWKLPHGFGRRRWDLEGMVGPTAHWGSWRTAIGLDAEGTAVIEQALGLVYRRLERFGTDPKRFGLIHADLRLANLLVEDTHLRIIDFDDCGFSWFLYDFATAVSFIEEQPAVPELLQAWLRGYDLVTPLSEEERAEIPTFVVLRRIVLTAWLASHSEVAFARQFGVAYTQGTVRLARQLLAGTLLINS